MTTALYRRYRPDTFDELIGQDHVTEPLKAALRANRVTHAYLFSGPRGCGKTTSARILARCLNCAEGPTDKPCGVCDSCRELATGGSGSLDVVEIDAASHGGVDDARDLRERATFAPVRDRYKVFIIDEAHMVTAQGFNALLKLVEEPPEHVKFIFATTEPERVIGTIRSRTHHYPFHLVPPDVLGPYLESLCAEEHMSVGQGVLGLVMRAGGGSVRDSLSVLDQLMAGSPDETLDYARAIALLGYTDSALLDETADALAGGDGAAVYRIVERLVDSGHEPRRFVEDFLRRLRDLLIIAVAGDGAGDVLSETPSDQLDRMQVQARNWGAPALSRAAGLTDQALREMTGATSPRLQLELLLARILVPPTGAAQTSNPAPAGSVGMLGGGAPNGVRPPDERSERDEPEGQSSQSFGAAQAREELRRKRSGTTGGSVPPEQPTRRVQTVEQTQSNRRTDQGQSAEPARPTPHEESEQPVQAVQPSQSAPPGADSPTSGDNRETHIPAAQGSVGPAGASTRHESVTPHNGTEPGQGTRSDPAPVQPDATADAEQPRQENHADLGGDVGASRGVKSADVLRQRWSEIVERLASISRSTWTLVQNNGQLGGVDGDVVVILFPHEGLVSAFVNRDRDKEVALAIHEATGLNVSVVAQVGQASGGKPVTTPSAPAAETHNTVEHSAQQPPDRPPAHDDLTDVSHSQRRQDNGTEASERPVEGYAASHTPQASHNGHVGGLKASDAPGASPAYQDTAHSSPGAESFVNSGPVEWGEVAIPGGGLNQAKKDAGRTEESGQSAPQETQRASTPTDSEGSSGPLAPPGSQVASASQTQPLPKEAQALQEQAGQHDQAAPEPRHEWAPPDSRDEWPEPEPRDPWPVTQSREESHQPQPRAEHAEHTSQQHWSPRQQAEASASQNEGYDHGVSDPQCDTEGPGGYGAPRARSGRNAGVFPSEPTAGGEGRTSNRYAAFADETPAPGNKPEIVKPRVSASADDSASIDDEDLDMKAHTGVAMVLETLGGKIIEEIIE